MSQSNYQMLEAPLLICHLERSETSLILISALAEKGLEIESLASRALPAALQLCFGQNDNNP
jgi:hypothetical protein